MVILSKKWCINKSAMLPYGYFIKKAIGTKFYMKSAMLPNLNFIKFYSY